MPWVPKPGPGLLNWPGKSFCFSLWGQHLLLKLKLILGPDTEIDHVPACGFKANVYAFAKVGASVPALARASLS